MFTRHHLNLVRSLEQRKYRQLHGLFIVEGEKSVLEILRSKVSVKLIFALQNWFDENKNIAEEIHEKITVTKKELERLSYLVSPQPVIAVAEIPKEKKFPADINSGIKLFLDNIRDPGNMGTIIRIADWYGLKEIFCSEETVDCFNPKVVQASMGSLFHIDVYYSSAEKIFSLYKNEIFGADMNGENIHKINKNENAFLVIGNEANGINKEIKKYITKFVSIPGNGNAESLNAPVAAGIILDNFFRSL